MESFRLPLIQAFASQSPCGETPQPLFQMKFTSYFIHTRTRPDRAIIRDEWIREVLERPEKSQIQSDGRIRLWRRIPEMDNRILRIMSLRTKSPCTTLFLTVMQSYENQILS